MSSDDVSEEEPPAARAKLSQPDLLKSPPAYHQDFVNKIEHIKYKDLYNKRIKMRSHKFIDLQLLKIITSKQKGQDKGSFRARYSSKPQKEQFLYSRMFLCRIIDQNSVQDSETCVYLVEGAKDNRTLWTHTTTARDDGTICPGTLFRVTHIQNIDYQIGNVDCIVTTCPVLVLKRPANLIAVPIKKTIEPDHTFAFCLKNQKVIAYDVTPVNTSCNGLFCDKQNAYELRTSGKCGCYQQQHGRAKMAICVNLSIENAEKEEQCAAEYFSSTQFSKYFLKGNFPSSIGEHEFIFNSNSYKVSDALFKCTKYVNDNEGWTVVGWYRLGRVTDKMMAGVVEEEDTRTIGTEVNCHIVSIYPSKQGFETESSGFASALELLKYDASQLYHEAVVPGDA